MKLNKNRGFTLIELLVVVAIIGILASVVMASLSTANKKSKDASVKESMKSMMLQAEILRGSGSTYPVDMCVSSLDFERLIKSINKQVPSANAVICNSSTTAWAADVKLNDGTVFCVDSVSFVGITQLRKGSAIACNQSQGQYPPIQLPNEI
ncbi:MAG: type II secretion system protein [Candidatus Paceibacterota bacterium]|jgi:prepilin-type N-terminal cleavage/methylation domain-containing protein